MQRNISIGVMIVIPIGVICVTLYSNREQNFMTSVLEIESQSIDGTDIAIADRTHNESVSYTLTGDFYTEFIQYLHATNVHKVEDNVVGKIQIIFRHHDKMYSISYNPDGYFIYDNNVYKIKDEPSTVNINELLNSAKSEK